MTCQPSIHIPHHKSYILRNLKGLFHGNWFVAEHSSLSQIEEWEFHGNLSKWSENHTRHNCHRWWNNRSMTCQALADSLHYMFYIFWSLWGHSHNNWLEAGHSSWSRTEESRCLYNRHKSFWYHSWYNYRRWECSWSMSHHQEDRILTSIFNIVGNQSVSWINSLEQDSRKTWSQTEEWGRHYSQYKSYWCHSSHRHDEWPGSCDTARQSAGLSEGHIAHTDWN